jgi:ubiquinone/menaquinone biosynthesis C-methylase UbiE
VASQPDRGREDTERRRAADSLERTYRNYLANPRKQRSWAADNPGNVAIREQLAAAVRDHADTCLARNGEALDIGCGSGWMLAQLAASGIDEPRLHGIDLLERRVEAAQQRLPAADLRVADARHLPYPDAGFALVLLLLCLSSIPDRRDVGIALRDAKRVLAPGGLLLVYEPRLNNPLNRATVAVTRPMLSEALGHEEWSRRLTGLPPVARRLGRATTLVYPTLARLLPTHRLTAFRG